MSPYSRVDKTPFGILKVIGSASLSIASSVEEMYGGSQRFSWAAEAKTFKAGFDAKVKAYPGFLFAQFMGASVTSNAAEPLASVAALANFKGASVLSAVTGIASVGVTGGNESNVKFGHFLVKAVTPTTVDVYALSDVDFPRGGTPLAFIDDTLKITATPLTIATAGVVTVIPNTGLQFVGGSGAIAMVAGDTATFNSRPENVSSEDVVIGAGSTALPAFGAIILAQKRTTAEMAEIEAYNCIAEGFPLGMDEMKFAEASVKVTCLYDSVPDSVFKIRFVNPTSFT